MQSSTILSASEMKRTGRRIFNHIFVAANLAGHGNQGTSSLFFVQPSLKAVLVYPFGGTTASARSDPLLVWRVLALHGIAYPAHSFATAASSDTPTATSTINQSLQEHQISA